MARSRGAATYGLSTPRTSPILRMGTRRAALHLDLFEQPGREVFGIPPVMPAVAWTSRRGRGVPARGVAGRPSARRIALDVLQRVEATGAYANLLLDARLRGAGCRRRLRALATALTYGVLRWQGRLDRPGRGAWTGRSRRGIRPCGRSPPRGVPAPLLSPAFRTSPPWTRRSPCTRAGGGGAEPGYVNAVLAGPAAAPGLTSTRRRTRLAT